MDLPSIVYREALKKNSVSKILNDSNQWFQDVYVKRIDKPSEPKVIKLLEVGKFYSFLYDAKYKKELEYWMYLPTSSLCIGHIEGENGKLNAMCINTAYIPPKIRMLILDKIVKVFNAMVLKHNEKMIRMGRYKSQNHMPLFYDICKRILKDSGFEFAIRSYIYTRMKTQPLIISYEDWWRVSVITSNKFLLKKDIRYVFYKYKQALDQSYKIGKKSPEVELKRTNIKSLKKYIDERGKEKKK